MGAVTSNPPFLTGEEQVAFGLVACRDLRLSLFK
jgi:hypothetical protein